MDDLKLVLSLSVLMTASSAVAQEVSPQETTEPGNRMLAAAIEEPTVDVGSVRDRSVTLWIEVPGAPSCNGAMEYGFLFDPLEDRRVLSDTTRSFTPDARLAIHCNPSTDRWSSSFGDLAAESWGGLTRFDVRASVEALPAVDLLWVAYVTHGGDAWFLPDPGADAMGRTARFSIYEIAKP